jgi:hypothetical protein
MKCPYTVDIEQISQDTYTYEDNQTTFHQNKLIKRREYINCLESECAVWIDGRCNYNQGHNG